ncbi:unnamed protein product [Rodentolepis nana]|uniref:Nucleoporin NUP42 n=1 Tax=Rodentolepis nana TaxID=102285 RepID=A0A0R3TXM5_RODNA|nr:unnamed protein product [Rodentolepis nana]
MSSRRCRYYLAGYCRNGFRCPFLHIDPYDSQWTQRVPPRSTMVLRTCRFYRNGHCAFGDGCEFFHPSGGYGVQKSEKGEVVDDERPNSPPNLQDFSSNQTHESLLQEKAKDPETLEDFGYQPEEVFSCEENLSVEELEAYFNEGEDAFSHIPLLPPPQNLCL